MHEKIPSVQVFAYPNTDRCDPHPDTIAIKVMKDFVWVETSKCLCHLKAKSHHTTLPICEYLSNHEWQAL